MLSLCYVKLVLGLCYVYVGFKLLMLNNPLGTDVYAKFVLC